MDVLLRAVRDARGIVGENGDAGAADDVDGEGNQADDALAGIGGGEVIAGRDADAEHDADGLVCRDLNGIDGGKNLNVRIIG